MTSRSIGHRAPLLWVVLPFAAGLVTARLGSLAPVSWLLGGALVCAIGCVVAAWRESRWWAPALLTAMFVAGNASYALHRARLPAWDAFPPREVRLDVRVDRVFAQPDARRTSGLATVVKAGTPVRELAGQRVYFSLMLRKGESPPIRSAIVSATGVVAALPRSPPSDSFDAYLEGAGINFRLTRGRIEGTVQPPSRYRAFCRRAAAKLAGTLGAGVEAKRPELTSVLRAMLLGQKHELSDEQGTLFMRSGTMHLFAISGLHIGMIAVGLHALLSLLRLPRPVQFAAGLGALWVYVEITGGTPSAVRAFIMVALVQASLVLRAPGNPLSALAASALVVLLAWPMQLFSASFQLSYGIVTALLLLGLPLYDAWQARWSLFRDLPKPAWRWYHHAGYAVQRKFAAALAIGVASTLVSTLGSVLFFKLLTPAALAANLVLIPAALLVILAGFGSLLCGLLGAAGLSVIFNHAAVLVLAGVDASVRRVVTLPGTWRPAEYTAAWIGPSALAMLMAVLVFGYASNWRRERGGWWPPFAVVGLALLLGVKFG